MNTSIHTLFCQSIYFQEGLCARVFISSTLFRPDPAPMSFPVRLMAWTKTTKKFQEAGCAPPHRALRGGEPGLGHPGINND